MNVSNNIKFIGKEIKAYQEALEDVMKNAIDGKIEEYQEVLSCDDLNIYDFITENEDSFNESFFSDELKKYYNYITCLKNLQEKLLYTKENQNNLIFDLLQQNYDKYDTLLIFEDNTELIINKNDIYVFEGDKYLFHTDNKSYSLIIDGVNLDYVKEFKTLK